MNIEIFPDTLTGTIFGGNAVLLVLGETWCRTTPLEQQENSDVSVHRVAMRNLLLLSTTFTHHPIKWCQNII